MAQDGDRLSLVSVGMPHLGLPDVVVTSPATQPGKALLQFYDLLLYVARRGAALPAGDTVGRTPGESIPVRYEASPTDPTVQVMRVDYP